MALFSTLTENWSGGIDTGIWNNWGGSPNVTVVSGEISIYNTSGASNYKGIETQTTYDLTGVAVSVQIISLPTVAAADTSWAFSPINLFITVDNRYFWEYNGASDTLIAYKVTAGSYNNIASVAYSSTNHKYLRIREASGTVYYDHSVDGITWTNLTSIATTSVAVTALYLGTSVGHWATAAAAYTSKTDNFNILPSGSNSGLLSMF